MAKERKTVDVYVIESLYPGGYGWEYDTCETDRKEAKQRLKEYRENSPYPVRMRKRRIPKAKFESGDF